MSEDLVNLASHLSAEIILLGTAMFLLLLGTSAKEAARRIAPVIAILAVGLAFLLQFDKLSDGPFIDAWKQIELTSLSQYFRLIALGVSVPLILLAWPTNADATGGKAIDFGKDVPEFFALMLMSISGILFVSAANDIILLFLGIELASIPTYVMVSVSRPIPAAQEAGVKYFFLGAMAAALLLFGLSYLYGTTGTLRLSEMASNFSVQSALSTLDSPGKPEAFSTWQMLAVLMVIAGLTFKMAAVPMYEYVADVYQGAATPVTAFLAFVPKTTGFIALLKILYTVGGSSWAVPTPVITLIAVLAVLTMTVGNVLGLLQSNIKRVLAYSSVAHTGYMLVGVAALLRAGDSTVQGHALSGVLFYLTAYGIMNAGAFGVLMLLPSRRPRPATSAETFDDIAGTGREHVLLGLAMTVCCFSLTGMPLTVGFLGKVLLIKPALETNVLNWLVIAMMINAAISAAYYLRIVGTMFLRADSQTDDAGERVTIPAPIGLAIAMSVLGTLAFGMYFNATSGLTTATLKAASLPAKAALTAAR
ncbi:F(420)H(2) dehydrogenase subunit N [soil metagenome]